MRIFKPKRRGPDGQVREYQKWMLEIPDHRGRQRRFSAYRDKRMSETLGKKIEALVCSKKTGEPLSSDLAEWLDGAPRSLKNHLLKIGLLEGRQVVGGEPIEALLRRFLDSLKARQVTKRHQTAVEVRLRRIFTECGFAVWTDVNTARLQQFLTDRTEEGKSARTRNLYLARFKQFHNWLCDCELITPLPGLRTVKPLNESEDRRKQRRALSVDELSRLFDATERRPLEDARRLNRGPDKGMIGAKLTPETEAKLLRLGQERRLCYEFAYTTGLRRKELGAVRIQDLDLGSKPRVTLSPALTKNRQGASLPLRQDLARRVGEFIEARGLQPGDKLFQVPVLRVFKADCEYAGIPLADDRGFSVDFHCLRMTLSSHLAAANVSPRTAMEILRHSTVSLTLTTYMDARLLDLRGAVEGLPKIENNRPDIEGKAKSA